ncbi:uncharacterized protein Z520_08318 [Fonsecaea multimorphosa CBS 102226]|uniref:Uncharacterized protein n=1 Tax=Fonsecaea multimorphosa CBS 102226 TaxID=1442371 RepID=A0A0D2KHC1_9EURO|nr:uncharacterized protein Z520_08318 [Fonsecaea multimorphosa CBS 102226]KIX96063.1 hypothetical protein Z520_08318 [Fonsecaea multimorphosa CBS 102226]OAL21829.1 hypothetical protein AYO22_07771 [Fonsecaea multimorphosa]
MATNTCFFKTSASQPKKLDRAHAQDKPRQAAPKQVAAPTPNKVVKQQLPRRREKASLFHKPQKRGPLDILAHTKLNVLDTSNEKHYDIVKPSASMRPHKDIFTVPSARGHKPRTITRIMAVPKFLIAPISIDRTPSKALLELIEQGQAEKAERQRQKEIDALFESDSEN